MLEMPDAAPTSSTDTAAVDAEEAGPLASPSPAAIAISGSTNIAYVQDASTNARTANPTAANANPAATAIAGPILPASGVISGVMSISAPAAGSVAIPAFSALIPKPAGSRK